MVSKFPKILYTNQQKYAIIRENAKIYQKARKKVTVVKNFVSGSPPFFQILN
jgi:hypothetical protein